MYHVFKLAPETGTTVLAGTVGTYGTVPVGTVGTVKAVTVPVSHY